MVAMVCAIVFLAYKIFIVKLEDNFMSSLLVYIIGVAVGAIVMWCITKPVKTYSQGWDAAKDLYNNWDKGYKLGFDDGLYWGYLLALGVKDTEEDNLKDGETLC